MLLFTEIYCITYTPEFLLILVNPFHKIFFNGTKNSTFTKDNQPCLFLEKELRFRYIIRGERAKRIKR
jgi:hypothetical protein